MDDLAGLDWSVEATRSTVNSQPTQASLSSLSYPALRPSLSPSISGRSTPLSTSNFGKHPTRTPTKPSTPANDSFSNLVSFGSAKSFNNDARTLQERQTQLKEDRTRQEIEHSKAFDAQFGIEDRSNSWKAQTGPEAFMNTFQRGSSNQLARERSQANNDLTSAFSAFAPVDASTNYPPPTASIHGIVSQEDQRSRPDHSSDNAAKPVPSIDDDDPFDLAAVAPRRAGVTAGNSVKGVDVDDDILGMLGKPVSELRKPKLVESSTRIDHGYPSVEEVGESPLEKAISELVEMGFTGEQASDALAQTRSGTDVHAAVGWLLTEAHRSTESRAKVPAHNRNGRTSPAYSNPDAEDRSRPAWMKRSDRSPSTQPRTEGRSIGQGEKDITKLASEVGSNLFKSANSLWKTGRKQVQKVVIELQTDSDPGQPRWMREAQSAEVILGQGQRRRPSDTVRHPTREASSHRPAQVTDEALMLEGGGRPPPKKQSRPIELGYQAREVLPKSFEQGSSGLPDATPSQSLPSGRGNTPQRPQSNEHAPRGRLSKQATEEQNFQAYVSPARRKKLLPQESHVVPELLAELAPSRLSPGVSGPTRAPNRQNLAPLSMAGSSPTKSPFKAPIQARVIPPISSHQLSASKSHRLRGTEAFKRGDYSLAHTSYSHALSSLPSDHPITIIVLCNRAIVNLRVGDSKSAVFDANTALSVIGRSRGDGEMIRLSGDEGEKEMRDFYGKALMRKAEGLEQMEKWAEAAKAWADAVEANVGGATSIQSRDRCQRANHADRGVDKVAGRPQVLPARRKPSNLKEAMPVKNSATQNLVGGPTVSSTSASAEAVSRLRQANAAAARADDERFALSDRVDAKLTGWKGGKQDNLRALLGSLDTILWAEAGWKKVGMHELVLAKKVKIVYMRGISKVHPDKLPTTATTEQRMISGAVFSTLNEAWDKFKKENGI